MFPQDYFYTVMIDRRGEQLDILKRLETVNENGEVIYSYNQTITTMAMVREVGGYMNIFDLPGYTKEIDLAGVFYAYENVDVGDLIVRANRKKYQVTQVMERGDGPDVSYLEVLMEGVE